MQLCTSILRRIAHFCLKSNRVSCVWNNIHNYISIGYINSNHHLSHIVHNFKMCLSYYVPSRKYLRKYSRKCCTCIILT